MAHGIVFGKHNFTSIYHWFPKLKSAFYFEIYFENTICIVFEIVLQAEFKGNREGR